MNTTEFWQKVYLSVIGTEKHGHRTALETADDAVKEFQKRFPQFIRQDGEFK